MAATGKTGTARQSRIDKALKAAYRPELTSGARGQGQDPRLRRHHLQRERPRGR